MIPQKKKSPEEIAALRSQLGIPEIPQESPQEEPTETPQVKQVAPENLIDEETGEPIIVLEIKSSHAPQSEHHGPEHALAPASPSLSKTKLPTRRHDQKTIAEIRRREILAQVTSTEADPVVQLRKITAHPILLIVTYLPALGAPIAAWQNTDYRIPAGLLLLATLLTFYIFLAKKRSRHHAAILTIIITMTLVFGGLHYAPLFNYAP